MPLAGRLSSFNFNRWAEILPMALSATLKASAALRISSTRPRSSNGAGVDADKDVAGLGDFS